MNVALELSLEPSQAAALLRSRVLAGLRAGRPRQRSSHVVWYDSADAALAADGLALAEQRAGWRLERLHPAACGEGAPWAPGTAPPLIAEAESLAALPVQQEGLMPLVAFDGRARILELEDPAGPIRLTLTEGTLRSVTREQPTCRVGLEGAAKATLALAQELTRHLPLAVPLASLAAEGHLLARGIAPSQGRPAVPQVPPGLDVGTALAHLIAQLAGQILHWAARVPDAQSPEPVHQMRVATRRLRSALSIFGKALGCPALADGQAQLKALAGQLGPARDWDVFLAGTGAELAEALPEEARIAALLEGARRRRETAYAALRDWLDGPEWRVMAIGLAGLAAARPWDAELAAPAQRETEAPPAQSDDAALTAETAEPAMPPLPPSREDCAAFAFRVLDRRFHRILRRGADFAALPAEQLHELRKSCKRLRYALEFFQPLLAEKPSRRLLGRLAELQEELGLVNDITVAAGLMAELPRAGGSGWAGGVVAGFLLAGTRKARRRAEDAWDKFRKTDAFWG